LIEEDTKGPDVRPRVVGLRPAELRGKVVRGPDHGSGQGGFRVEQLCHAQIPDFDLLAPAGFVLVDEDIGRFHVPVQDLPGVEVVQAQGHLNKDGPYFFFGNASAIFPFQLVDDALKVPAIAVFHYNVQFFPLYE